MLRVMIGLVVAAAVGAVGFVVLEWNAPPKPTQALECAVVDPTGSRFVWKRRSGECFLQDIRQENRQ